MRFKPNYREYNYPEKTYEHMIIVKHKVDTNFDENHRYYNKTWWYKTIRFFTSILLIIVGPIVMYFRYGFKVKGRKNVRKAKKFKKNVLTICNHVFMWDYVGVLCALRPKMEYLLAWPVNLEGPNRHLIKLVGGIPIPTEYNALKKFNAAVNECIEDGNWLHVYPEGSMWFYYSKIRPLRKGCFKYAYKYDMPILPMAYSYRPRKGLLALYNKKEPLLTLTVGEPLFINKDLSMKEAILDIQKRCFHEMQILAGISVDDPDYQNWDENWNL